MAASRKRRAGARRTGQKKRRDTRSAADPSARSGSSAGDGAADTAADDEQSDPDDVLLGEGDGGSEDDLSFEDEHDEDDASGEGVDDGIEGAGNGASATERAIVPARGRSVATSDPLGTWIREVRRFPELDPEEERALARRYRETGDADAARRLVTANLRLVVKLALMYRRALRNVMDLIQEGNIGLMEALKRFDPEQGVKFSTYASWWIKAYILKFLMDNARLVRVGTTNARRKLLYNLRKEQRKLRSQGIDPTPRLLADRFGVSQDDVIDVDRALSSRDVSVDMPLGEDSRSTLADVMADPIAPVDEQVAASEIREKVDEAIAEFRTDLDERDRTILDLRLVAEDPATLQQLGDRYGVTREAMRQAEAKLKIRLATFLKERLGDEIELMFGEG